MHVTIEIVITIFTSKINYLVSRTRVIWYFLESWRYQIKSKL